MLQEQQVSDLTLRLNLLKGVCWDLKCEDLVLNPQAWRCGGVVSRLEESDGQVPPQPDQHVQDSAHSRCLINVFQVSRWTGLALS